MQRTVAVCVLATPALADSVKIENAWARATAPGQKVAGGFMDLTADADMAVVGGSSPVSTSLELHIMKMDGGVMEMRQLKEIALPKGQTVKLEPGGLHIVFIGLKQPITEGAWARATAPVKTTNGKRKTIAVEAEARRTSRH